MGEQRSQSEVLIARYVPEDLNILCPLPSRRSKNEIAEFRKQRNALESSTETLGALCLCPGGRLTQGLLAPHTQRMVPPWASMNGQLSCAAKQLALSAAGPGVPSLPQMRTEPGRTRLCLPQQQHVLPRATGHTLPACRRKRLEQPLPFHRRTCKTNLVDFPS